MTGCIRFLSADLDPGALAPVPFGSGRPRTRATYNPGHYSLEMNGSRAIGIAPTAGVAGRPAVIGRSPYSEGIDSVQLKNFEQGDSCSSILPRHLRRISAGLQNQN